MKKFAPLPRVAEDLFYLLADYTFKSKCDMNRAIEFYCLDLSFNPERLDSWAALALSWAQKLDRQLNSCRKLDPAQILEHTQVRYRIETKMPFRFPCCEFFFLE